MKTTSTHFKNRSHRTAIVTFIAVFGLIACGSDKKTSTSSQPPTTETSVAPATSTEPVPLDQKTGIFVHPDHPTCTFRKGELIVRVDSKSLDSLKEIIGPFLDVGRVGSPDTLEVELHLLRIGIDPLAAAELLFKSDIQAAPNYLYAFAPGWIYSPYGPPTSHAAVTPRASQTGTQAPTIAVLDTGWLALNAPQGPVLNVTERKSSSPPGALAGASTQTEVTAGRAAGHGTFIINELGQLLPNATYIAAGISPRYQDDDGYLPPSGGTTVSIRDDSTVTAALAETVDSSVNYLNASFGTYGCTALHKPPANISPSGVDGYWNESKGKDMEPYYKPLGLRTALEAKLKGMGIQVFAASGNDAHGPFGTPTPEIFYPAGFAPDYDWVHSVASDPKGGFDYSNRGAWVETQARGSRTVSQLPVTSNPPAGWGSEGWYEWSGTSFAAPCALAERVITGATPKYVHNPTHDRYIECGLNVPSAP